MADPVALAAAVKLLVLDVDGVLTDGGLYYDSQGNVTKRFNVLDGFGIKVAQSVGLEIGVITGLKQPAVEKRVRELGIKHYYSGKHEKGPLLKELCAKAGVPLAETAFMGDDWIDMVPMRLAGLAMASANAMPEVLALADWVSMRAGGDGAVREAVQFILEAQGLLEDVRKQWTE